MDSAEAEVLKMFGPQGNYDDRFLNYEPPDDRPGWMEAERVVRAILQREMDSWSPDEDIVIALMRGPYRDRGGGIKGASPELAAVRTAMSAFGERVLDAERRMLARRTNRV